MTFSLQNPAENRWWVLGVLLMVLLSLVGYVWFLHRQRRRFLETMRRLPVDGRHAWKRDPLRDRQEQAVDNRQNEATNRSAGITPAGTLGGVPHYSKFETEDPVVLPEEQPSEYVKDEWLKVE